MFVLDFGCFFVMVPVIGFTCIAAIGWIFRVKMISFLLPEKMIINFLKEDCQCLIVVPFLGSDMRSLRSLIFWSIYLLRSCSICRFKVFFLDVLFYFFFFCIPCSLGEICEHQVLIFLWFSICFYVFSYFQAQNQPSSCFIDLLL